MLPPLATEFDAVRFGYDLGEDAGSLLDRASARVRRAAGQPITAMTSTVRLPVERGEIVLPSPPITAVASVAGISCAGVVATVTGWCWDGGDRVSGVAADRAEVTFTHGYPAIPDELLDLVCSVAQRLGQTTPGMEAGVREEAVDDYRVVYAAEAVSTASGLLPGELSALAEFVPTGGVAVVKSR